MRGIRAALVKLLTVAIASYPVFWVPASAQQTANTINQTVEQTMQYLLYLPDDYETSSGKRFPLMLFLHGGGEGGSDIELVKIHGPPKLVEQGEIFPFIIVAPQNPSEELLFPIATVSTLLDDIIANYRVDEDRVYLTGLSRGAFGAWQMAMQYPDKFAAVVPIAGGGIPNYVNRIGEDVPIWAFHGAKDDVIPLSASVEMVEALLTLESEREEGEREVKLTVYPEAGHQESWEMAYGNSRLYRWLLQQSK